MLAGGVEAPNSRTGAGGDKEELWVSLRFGATDWAVGIAATGLTEGARASDTVSLGRWRKPISSGTVTGCGPEPCGLNQNQTPCSSSDTLKKKMTLPVPRKKPPLDENYQIVKSQYKTSLPLKKRP